MSEDARRCWHVAMAEDCLECRRLAADAQSHGIPAGYAKQRHAFLRKAAIRSGMTEESTGEYVRRLQLEEVVKDVLAAVDLQDVGDVSPPPIEDAKGLSIWRAALEIRIALRPRQDSNLRQPD